MTLPNRAGYNDISPNAQHGGTVPAPPVQSPPQPQQVSPQMSRKGPVSMVNMPSHMNYQPQAMYANAGFEMMKAAQYGGFNVGPMGMNPGGQQPQVHLTPSGGGPIGEYAPVTVIPEKESTNYHGNGMGQVGEFHMAMNMPKSESPVVNRQPEVSYSEQEIQIKKQWVKSHRLLPNIFEVLNSCRKEGMLWQPVVDASLANFYPMNENGTDVSLEEFLQSQGIETVPLNSEDSQKNIERQEFLGRLEQIKEKYNEELERLNRVCNECCMGMLGLLRDQLTVRPVTDQESHMKIVGIQYRFHNVKNKLRQNVFNSILAEHKQYNQTRKKKRMLPKKATESLSQWFFDHINDPYPSEEEKSTLAAAAGLTLTQVNNWFGNKRIRYKRKCLEEDTKTRSKRGSDAEDHAGLTAMPPVHVHQQMGQMH